MANKIKSFSQASYGDVERLYRACAEERPHAEDMFLVAFMAPRLHAFGGAA